MQHHLTVERHNRALELPEIISGLLALFIVLWEVCYERMSADTEEGLTFILSSHYILCGIVFFNTSVVLVHVLSEAWKRHLPGRFLSVQLIFGLADSLAFAGLLENWHALGCFWITLITSLVMGLFAIVNLVSYLRSYRSGPTQRNGYWWSPAVIFFTSMVVLVLLSTLILLTPGATYPGITISPVDALFTSASATSITGLMCINAADTFTPLGKFVLLLDIQVGALGVITFSYLILLMLGKKLAVRDSKAMSGVLDVQDFSIVPSLLKAVFGITLTAELAGSVLLYMLWHGQPGIPQDHLVEFAVFHAVSSFCNAGITIFPDGMEHLGVAGNFGVQVVMMALMLIGTMGFGVHLEALQRLRARLAGRKLPPRWSTNSWLVIRVTFIVLLIGTLGMTLLSVFEDSTHSGLTHLNAWEALWNSVSRSGGFNLTDIDTYGPVYKLFLMCMMFVGGNPAGTGGGVFAPVFALCVFEVLRVLRGAADVEMHGRRIARSTVDRAMSTVVLSIFWIVVTTMLILLLEPEIAHVREGIVRVAFMEVSAYTTTGFDLGIVPRLSDISKIIVTFTMLFGRVGMFTFMLIFIRREPRSNLRYPETRLPLN